MPRGKRLFEYFMYGGCNGWDGVGGFLKIHQNYFPLHALTFLTSSIKKFLIVCVLRKTQVKEPYST